MYNQGYNGSALYGAGYGMDYQPQQQQYYYQQQQHYPATQKQQMVAGVMGYYTPEAAAMIYNPYAYGLPQQHAFMQHHPQQHKFAQAQVDFQLTPALYLLNQQAEQLQRTLYMAQHSEQTKKNGSGAPDGAKAPRRVRGPYKRRTNKSLSPSASPAPEHETDSDRLSLSDVSGSNNRSSNSIQSLDQQQQQQQRKRKSDSFQELEQQQTKKQSKTAAEEPSTRVALRRRRQSIFCSVDMMAESSCTNWQR